MPDFIAERWCAPMMGWNHYQWGFGGWVAMALMMVIFWGLVAALVMWIVRSQSRDRPHADGAERPAMSPDSVLAQRFARGEIDEDEFARRRAVLRGPIGGAPTTSG